MDAEHVAARLAAGGFVAAEEEAAELVAAAADAAELDAMLTRRLTGEPLAWITGTTTFCGLTLAVAPGVYVPRWHTELVAQAAIERLPADGVAIDLCTGCGALAAALQAARPHARVVATDLDPAAVACARANGVEAHIGDLFAPLPTGLPPADVVCGVVPYVPDDELHLLQRDTFTFESRLPYDGGAQGTAILARVVAEAPVYLRPGGALVLELGGDQPAQVGRLLHDHGFSAPAVLRDEDGDVRGIVAEHAAADAPASGTFSA